MLIEKLQSCRDFTSTERTLAEYILSHAEAVMNMNIRQLAQAAVVSPPTVSRLCRKLGLDGYSTLKVQLAAEHQELLHRMREVNINYPFNEGDSLKEIAEKMADLSVEQIRAASRSLDYVTLSRAVRAICVRKQVFLFGMGLSHAVSDSFTDRMVRLGYSVQSSADTGLQLAYAYLADPKRSTAIVISHSGTTPDILRSIRILHQNGVPTLLITGNPVAPMIQYASWVCCLSSTENLAMEDKIDSFGFPMAVHYLLDCLYAMVFADDYAQNLERAKLVNHEQFNR